LSFEPRPRLAGIVLRHEHDDHVGGSHVDALELLDEVLAPLEDLVLFVVILPDAVLREFGGHSPNVISLFSGKRQGDLELRFWGADDHCHFALSTHQQTDRSHATKVNGVIPWSSAGFRRAPHPTRNSPRLAHALDFDLENCL
jgi:hypothetical protein